MLDAVIATGIACDPRHLDRPFVHLAAFHGPRQLRLSAASYALSDSGVRPALCTLHSRVHSAA